MGKKIKGTVELVFSEDDIKAELIFSPGDQETDLITPEEINKVFAEKKLLPLSLDNINTALSKVSHLTEKGAVFLAEGCRQKADPAACGGHRGAGAAADCGPCPHRKGLLRRGGEKQILRHDLQHGQLVSDQARFEPAGCF